MRNIGSDKSAPAGISWWLIYRPSVRLSSALKDAIVELRETARRITNVKARLDDLAAPSTHTLPQLYDGIGLLEKYPFPALCKPISERLPRPVSTIHFLVCPKAPHVKEKLNEPQALHPNGNQ